MAAAFSNGSVKHTKAVIPIGSKSLLHVGPGQTTADRQFSLNVVNCLGVCAIGPVMMVDRKFYGEMNPIRARRIIEKINQNKKNDKGSGVRS